VETKSASAKMVAEVDSEEEESSFCSLDPGYIISTASELFTLRSNPWKGPVFDSTLLIYIYPVTVSFR
jgi:hypothetical protein